MEDRTGQNIGPKRSQNALARDTSGHLSPALIQEFMATYQDPRYWTSVISFVATWG
jgi:hypothetical protein